MVKIYRSIEFLPGKEDSIILNEASEGITVSHPIISFTLGNRFCAKSGWECPGNNIDGAKYPAGDFVTCLRKCVLTTNCAAAHLRGGQCQLKSAICDPAERVESPGGVDYYRLSKKFANSVLYYSTLFFILYKMFNFLRSHLFLKIFIRIF